ncbi:hypothetical protein J45TS6_17620 [Paenibacillus sp. J45TS6]|nr:hypothetical protein J45TS6_17620 [Paenibacillus sp. J45TS6]
MELPKNELLVNPQDIQRHVKGNSRLRELLKAIYKHRISYLYIAPFTFCFLAFIFIPIVMAFGLSFTYYNAIEPPRFIGWKNF